MYQGLQPQGFQSASFATSHSGSHSEMHSFQNELRTVPSTIGCTSFATAFPIPITVPVDVIHQNTSTPIAMAIPISAAHIPVPSIVSPYEAKRRYRDRSGREDKRKRPEREDNRNRKRPEREDNRKRPEREDNRKRPEHDSRKRPEHDTRKRPEHDNRKRPTRVQEREDRSLQARRQDENRRRNVVNQHRQYARNKGELDIAGTDSNGKCKCPDHCICDICYTTKGGSRSEALEDLFHASTNVFMDMDHSSKVFEELLDKFVRVSEDRKNAMRKEWASPDRMMHGLPLASCASCGIRDPELDYYNVRLSKLPSVFQLNEDARKRREDLEPVTMYFPRKHEDGYDSRLVDIRPIMSCVKLEDGRLYHLHPEFVNIDEDGSDASMLFCQKCYTHVPMDGEDEKTSAPLRSIAAGVDYGVLARVPEFCDPDMLLSEAEQMLLSEVRLYHVIAKVSVKVGSLEIQRDATINGDVIYFPHDGPKEAAATIHERAAWLRGADFRVLFVGPDGQHDNLSQWLLKRNDIKIRPHTCHNYLQTYRAIDCAMRNTKKTDAFSFEDSTWHELANDSTMLVDDARQSSTGVAQAVEAMAQASGDDVAHVANPEVGDAFSRVVLLSSSGPSSNDTVLSRLDVFHTGLQAIEGDSVAHGNNSTPNEDDVNRGAAGTSNMRYATRSDEPLSEFKGNGLNLMYLFRAICPLLRYEEHEQANGGVKVLSWPLQADGALTHGQTRHLLLQFTAAAASTPACIAVLANQCQRHAVLKTVSRRVPHDKFEEYTKLIQSPNFWERIKRARDNPESSDAKVLLDQLTSLIMLVGKDKPFSSIARKALKPKMMAIANRHGDPSIFWSLSPDSVHNELTLRLSFKSNCNSRFPAFASSIANLNPHICQLDDTLTNAWMDALRTHGEYDEAKAVTDPTLNLCFKFNCGEASLQRRVAHNPVAVALTFERIINAMLEVLVCLPIEKRNKKTEALRDCLHNRKHTERRPGIYGVCAAGTHVFEVSGKKVPHGHGMLWTCASAKLLAKIAHEDHKVQMFADAIATQLSARVGWEVHVLHKARRLLKVPAPRGAFATIVTEPTEGSTASVAFQALTLGDHEHTFTCHKGSGKCGCRSCFRRGHGQHDMTICQLIHDDVLPKEMRAEFEEMTMLDVETRSELSVHLRGDNGKPHKCRHGCKLHWWGEEGEENRPEPFLPVWLVKPQKLSICAPCHVAASNENVEPDLEENAANDGVTSETTHTFDNIEQQPFLWRDDRAIIFELSRPEVVCESTDLANRIKACDTSDGEAALSLVTDLLGTEPVQNLLGSERLAHTKARLEQITTSEAAQLIEACKSLGCANADLVEWNDVLMACTGSNAAPYFLGAGHGAAAALFYLIKYFTKNSLEVNSALIVLLDARDHLETYGSRAADAGTPQRDARFMMQRVLNKLDTELALTEAASMLLDHDHDGSSEQCNYIDIWDASRVAKQIVFLQGDNSAADDVNIEKEATMTNPHAAASSSSSETTFSRPLCIDDIGPVGPAHELLSLSVEEEIDIAAVAVAGSAEIYQLNGQPLPVSWMEHYQHRGEGLRTLSYVIYRCTIQIVKAPSQAKDFTATKNQQSRPKNTVWQFAFVHPLYGAYVQQQRSRFVCPIVGNVPHPPQPLQSNEPPNHAWLQRQKRAVEFYVAGFVPWDGNKPPPLTAKRLKQYIQEAQKNASRQPHSNSTIDDELTSARITAAGRLRLLENFMNGLQIAPEMMRASKQMRMRNRHEWTDVERDDYVNSLRAAGLASEAQREIAKLRSRQEARASSESREKNTAQAENWRRQLQEELHRALAPSSHPNILMEKDTPHPLQGHMQGQQHMPEHHCSDDEIKSIAAKYGEVLENEPAQEVADPTPPSLNLNAASSSNQTSEIAMPAILAHVSKEQYEEEKSEWRRTYEDSFKRGEKVPLPPLNRMQRSAGRRLLPVLRRLSVAQTEGLRANQTRQEYTEAVALLHHMKYMLVGAPGTGKSLLLRALLQLMDTEDLGGVVFCAYTGVAVTALPLPAATFCKLTGIPGDAGSMLEDLPGASDKMKNIFKAIVGNVDRLVMIVLDEASFLGTPHLHHLDLRLQELLGCNLPFGGLIVVLAGGASKAIIARNCLLLTRNTHTFIWTLDTDFHQLQPVSGYALHVALVRDAVPEDDLKTLGISGQTSELGADRKGTALLMEFQRMLLDEQMRAADDPEHAKHLACQRDTTSKQPVTEDFIKSLKPLTSEAIEQEGQHAIEAARAKNPTLSEASANEVAEKARNALRFAKIGVLSQRERHSFNLLQARLFARHHRRPLYWWKLPLTGIAASYLTEEETKQAYIEEAPGLCFSFVEDAPASITSNIETGRGLVNGCDATLHSLTLAGQAKLEDYLANAEWNSHYGIWEIQIDPPLAINAIPHVSDEARKVLLERGASLLTDKLVVPVLVGTAPTTYAPTSSWSARVCIPKELRLMKHQIDLAFAVTDYKVQGKTLNYFIVSIGKRGAGVFPKLSLVDVHVLVSRVRLGAHLFVIGLDPNDVDHLRKLRPSQALGIWEHGYNETTGTWEPQRAAAFAATQIAALRKKP